MEQKKINFGTNLTQPSVPGVYPGFPDQSFSDPFSAELRWLLWHTLLFPHQREVKIKKENCKCNRHVGIKKAHSKHFLMPKYFCPFLHHVKLRALIYFVTSLFYHFQTHQSTSFLITRFRINVFLNNFIFHL